MSKKNSRKPSTQANHDRNVLKSSHGKFRTAADMQSYGKENAKKKKKAEKEE